MGFFFHLIFTPRKFIFIFYFFKFSSKQENICGKKEKRKKSHPYEIIEERKENPKKEFGYVCLVPKKNERRKKKKKKVPLKAR